MRNNDIESSLKRFLKRKVKITLGVVVAFLITGVVGYGGDIVAEGKIRFIQKMKLVLESLKL